MSVIIPTDKYKNGMITPNGHAITSMVRIIDMHTMYELIIIIFIFVFLKYFKYGLIRVIIRMTPIRIIITPT